jgi:hypothetical protein
MPYGGSAFSLMKKRRAIDPTRMGFGTIRYLEPDNYARWLNPDAPKTRVAYGGSSGALNANPELSGISLDSASGPTMQEFLATKPTMPNLSGEPVATSQVVGKPPGGQHQGFPDMTKSGGKKGLDYEGMTEALSELQFAEETFKSLGKSGGSGGGGFKLFPNSMVENRTPIGPFDEDEQRKRWWAMYGKTA